MHLEYVGFLFINIHAITESSVVSRVKKGKQSMIKKTKNNQINRVSPCIDQCKCAARFPFRNLKTFWDGGK